VKEGEAEEEEREKKEKERKFYLPEGSHAASSKLDAHMLGASVQIWSECPCVRSHSFE
jgi:N-acetyl-beta-hexosaminidase